MSWIAKIPRHPAWVLRGLLLWAALCGTISAQQAAKPVNANPSPSAQNPVAPQQTIVPAAQQPASTAQVRTGWAGTLYDQLNNTTLDPARVYHIREAALDREDLHLSFEDGTIAFTTAVDGRITGAFFEGYGEVLLIPPDRVERWSLGQFTGSAILEERFRTAYLRFNDDTFREFEPWLRNADPDEAQQFLTKWSSAAATLSQFASLRLLNTFVDATKPSTNGKTEFERSPKDRMLYVRLSTDHLGIFDLHYDTLQPEQIMLAHLSNVEGTWFYDVWTSFPSRSARNAVRTRSATLTTQAGAEAFESDGVRLPQYKLTVQVNPPREIQVDALVDVDITQAGHRFIAFELSRNLVVREVTVDGKPAEFVQNQALKGSELERKGNDTVAVILPRAPAAGEHLRIHFVYGGEVLADAGGGLLYVGARGIWYPNRGLALSNFDMNFTYPAEWTLLATGKRQSEIRSAPNAADPVPMTTSHWVTERAIPFAGFNLGRYVKATASAGNAEIASYAARGVESTFRRPQTVLVLPAVRPGTSQRETVVVSDAPTPSNNAQKVADEGARTVEFLSRRLGPYPYSELNLTQMPGTLSQGWPGLIYLSSYAYLSPDELAQLKLDNFATFVFGELMEPHEIGHQWWGDLMIWKSYREQWLVEALSNYCALAMIEEREPAKFREALDHYRRQLLAKNKNGVEFTDAGPVTLGVRLNSSRFPDAYEAISYGRGTWLFHMLREMLLNPGPAKPGQPQQAKRGSPDEPFFKVLRRVREQYEGKEVTTRDLQKAFEEDLPPQLWYEGRKSLDWFFDSWINGVSIPKFELTDVKFSSRKAGPTFATGKILEKDATEGLVTSLPVYAVVEGQNVMLGRVFVEAAETSFRFAVPASAKKILLDPYGTVLTRP